MNELKPPVIIIGTTRSGTSMLVRTLGMADGVACWYEPNALWKVGSAYNGSDYAGGEHAKPWVKRWIRRKFKDFQDAAEGRRVIEKSPTNVLRIQFVHEVFPDAKIVYIYRDGRANLRSQIEKISEFSSYTVASPDVRDHLKQRLALIPFWEWPAYMPRALSGPLRRYLFRKSGVYWFGLRYPGWRRDRRKMTSSQIAASQWVKGVSSAFEDLESIPENKWISLRYEDLVSEPQKWISKVCDFCEIPISESFMEQVASRIHDRSSQRWMQELDPVALKEAMPILRPLLDRLGYEIEHN